MASFTKTSCPVCGSEHWHEFFPMLNVPIYCNVLWPSQEQARHCPKGDIRLAFCGHCGFIGNTAFDAGLLEYQQDYENALDFSPRFQEYARSLAQRLIDKYDLHQKDIVEIGCGKGEFLVSLCEMGNNRGFGFDPSYVPLPEHDRVKEHVHFIQDFYSDRYANYQADFICCRHTLEHVQHPVALLKALRQAIGDRPQTAIFFEVPNALDTFRHQAIWDIIYEHCCYFAPVTLSHAFAIAGFQVTNISEEYQGQFLCLEAKLAEPQPHLTTEHKTDVQQLTQDITTFVERFQAKTDAWQQKLAYMANQGQRAVIWGGGSKGVTFLNVLNVQTPVDYVVDINPRKQGKYVAGTGQQIVAPEFLREYQPDVVLIMNSIYRDEIRQMTQQLGLEVELVCLD